MSKFEIIVIVLLAVNGFWGFCCMGLLNKLCELFGAMCMTLAEGLEKLADNAERKN